MDRKTFCKKIKEARLRAKIKQEEAAAILAVSKSTISEIESGKRKLDVMEFFELSKLYKTDIKSFFEPEFTEKTNKSAVSKEALRLFEKAPIKIQNALAYAMIGFLKQGQMLDYEQ